MRTTRLLSVLALLASARGVDAATCTTRDLPAATLLLPHFRVSRNGTQGADIPEGGVDTLVSVTNTAATGLIVHATVWSKYGKPVLGFDVPLGAKDVAFFRMKDVLNGKLNVNPNFQDPSRLPNDPCGLNVVTGVYAPVTGFGAARFVRFPNPDAADAVHAISIYPTPAFSGAGRRAVWASLDESRTISTVTFPLQPGVIDTDNPACGIPGEGALAGDFSGSMTFDVANYCTTRLPDDPSWYLSDGIATRGWSDEGQTPNALIGDAFFADPDPEQGAVSGEALVGLPFDERLDWRSTPTFYARYSMLEGPGPNPSPSPAAYQFPGDGRMPLGSGYGFRYLSDARNGLRSWVVLYHTDVRPMPAGMTPDLCAWLASCRRGGPGCEHYGSWNEDRHLLAAIYDDDENRAVDFGVSRYAFLESERIDLLDNVELNPAAFKAGWAELSILGDQRTSQSYVSVQHRAAGGASVTVPGAVLKYPYSCTPVLTTAP